MQRRFIIQIILLLIVALGAWLFYVSRQPRFTSGEPAPDFIMYRQNGNLVQLKDYRGKFVLLHFWGSWCGPCRAENPHLVELYKKYHSRGFYILSVGIERNAEAWKRAIQQDGLIWDTHTSSLREFDSDIAKLFNVKSIPSTFLINSEGLIIGVKLSPDQIDKILSEQLP